MISTKESNALPVEIRSIIETDVPFIFNSWLKAFRNSRFAAPVNQNVYFSEQHKLVEKLLGRATTLVVGAASDPATVYGYVCYEYIQGVFVLHFAYVKHDFRTLGLFKTLMDATKHDFSTLGMYTHQIRGGYVLEDKYNLVYSPYLLINY